ncbi:endo-1,4-beta-xylanase [Tessaracoccus sp. Z1128]
MAPGLRADLAPEVPRTNWSTCRIRARSTPPLPLVGGQNVVASTTCMVAPCSTGQCGAVPRRSDQSARTGHTPTVTPTPIARPGWINSPGAASWSAWRDCSYIKEVLTHFKGRIVSWDVVNEAFVDGLDSFDPATQNWEDFLRGNPTDYSYSGWYNAYTTDMDVEAGERPGDFIYDAFVFARKYGPEAKLEYNDFNVFQSEGKARAILAMATELNGRYAAEYPDDPRQLIKGIGLQSHNYINQTPAFACADLTRLPGLVDADAAEWQPGACSDHASVERSLQLITEAGFTASVSELDLQVWEAWNAEPQGERGTYYDLDDPAAAELFHKEGFTGHRRGGGSRPARHGVHGQDPRCAQGRPRAGHRGRPGRAEPGCGQRG